MLARRVQVARIGNSAKRFCQILQGHPMKTQSLFVAGWFAAVALAAGSLSAADARLQQLTDQLRGRTARLIFETSGLFADSSNYGALETDGRAMHDTAESLFKTASAASPSHEHLDKDLATLDHYRVQYARQCDILARELRGLWGDAFAGNFVEEDLRVLRFRVESIERLSSAIDHHLHPGPADRTLAGDISSRPGAYCPTELIPGPALPELPLPRSDGPGPVDPRPGTGGAGLGPAPIPEGVLPRPRIPDGLVPGPAIPRPDLGSPVPLPGIGTGSGSGSGSGSPGRIPGIPRDRLLPGVRDSILRDALGSRPGSSGRATGVGPLGGTLLPGALGPRGTGGIGVPLPGR